jgi:hypothetical protein
VAKYKGSLYGHKGPLQDIDLGYYRRTDSVNDITVINDGTMIIAGNNGLLHAVY